MRMPAFPLILILFLMDFSAAKAAPGADTGIEGIITISPVQAGPVRAGSAGALPLANTEWVVRDDKGVVAAEFTTDAQGRFRALLPPGRYSVSLKNRKTGVGKYGPFEVQVSPGQMSRVTWQCDTGIR